MVLMGKATVVRSEGRRVVTVGPGGRGGTTATEPRAEPGTPEPAH
jgi:hypothetical protein